MWKLSIVIDNAKFDICNPLIALNEHVLSHVRIEQSEEFAMLCFVQRAASISIQFVFVEIQNKSVQCMSYNVCIWNVPHKRCVITEAYTKACSYQPFPFSTLYQNVTSLKQHTKCMCARK